MEFARYEHETDLLKNQLRQREQQRDQQKQQWESRELQMQEQMKQEQLQVQMEMSSPLQEPQMNPSTNFNLSEEAFILSSLKEVTQVWARGTGHATFNLNIVDGLANLQLGFSLGHPSEPHFHVKPCDITWPTYVIYSA